MYPTLENIINQLVECIQTDHKILVFGVGGNAANAIHFAAELQGKYEKFEKPLPCIDLCSNPSIITAITNDFGWDQCFARQRRGLAQPGDVILAFSISTKGKYLEQAFLVAKGKGAKCILSCGSSTGEGFLEDVTVLDEDTLDTPWVQEKQLELIHQICREVKERLALND